VGVFIVITGKAFTVIVVVAVFVQLFASVPLTVYALVTTGESLMEVPVAEVFQV
jgi:hypothetical protein